MPPGPGPPTRPGHWRHRCAGSDAGPPQPAAAPPGARGAPALAGDPRVPARPPPTAATPLTARGATGRPPPPRPPRPGGRRVPHRCGGGVPARRGRRPGHRPRTPAAQGHRAATPPEPEVGRAKADRSSWPCPPHVPRGLDRVRRGLDRVRRGFDRVRRGFVLGRAAGNVRNANPSASHVRACSNFIGRLAHLPRVKSWRAKCSRPSRLQPQAAAGPHGRTGGHGGRRRRRPRGPSAASPSPS